MITNRATTICLLEILKEYSDDTHILQMNEIISKMNTLYGLEPDRRTLYSAFALLKELGYDISGYEENGIGYYLRERDFEKSEIVMLMDAVYSFPFITDKQSRELIKKLQKQLCVNSRKTNRNLAVVRSTDRKTLNRQVFYNIERLDEAISQNRQVSFRYMKYGIDKKLHPRRKLLYTVNTYGMIYTNEHYYLVCSLAGCSEISLYRIDRMSDITILDTRNDENKNAENKTKKAIYAFSGEPEHISLKCRMNILDNVIDRFGIDIRITEHTDDYFYATVLSSPKGVKFWALQYLPYVEVLKPEWLRNDIIESIEANPYT